MAAGQFTAIERANLPPRRLFLPERNGRVDPGCATSE